MTIEMRFFYKNMFILLLVSQKMTKFVNRKT